jgi:hypothetical protein
MTLDSISPSREEPSFSSEEDQLRRQLMEQFYESSVDRYGADSEQARMFSQLISAATKRSVKHA